MKPIIVPTMKQNTSLASSKEKQIIQEIQKKEEKANENRKKVLAERQLKVEENKKYVLHILKHYNSEKECLVLVLNFFCHLKCF